jgi:hypothetical protein
MPLKCYFGLHSWDGCKCTKCGTLRNKNHDWNSETCSKCGKNRSITPGTTFTPEIDKIFIQLKCGRKVYVHRFTYYRTYWSLIDGTPDIKYNKGIIEWEKCPKDWEIEYSRKVLKIQPNDEEVNTLLPPSVYKVWLISNDPIDKYDDASELIVIWFDENPGNRSLKEIIEKGVINIEWEKHAEGFSY